MSSSTYCGSVATLVGRTGRLTEREDLFAKLGVLLQVLLDVVVGVFDDQLDGPAIGDAAPGVDLVPVDLLSVGDVDDQRSERTRQVGE